MNIEKIVPSKSVLGQHNVIVPNLVQPPWIYILLVAGITGGVFTEPEDQYAFPGEDAEFVCNNTNSNGPVHWRIKSYDLCTVIPLLPQNFDVSKYSYLHKVLTVHNVRLEHDGSTYQCVFFPFPSSKVATLHVTTGN